MPTTTTTTTSTTSTTEKPRISMVIRWHNCTIAGEGSGNNPEYCLAFYDDEKKREKVLLIENDDDDELTTSDDTELDCCWTANEHSALSPLLKDLVIVHPNGTM